LSGVKRYAPSSSNSGIFYNIDGGSGGRATIYIAYETDVKLAKINLIVNNSDWSLVNLPGPDGCAYITVDLNADANNTVRLTKPLDFSGEIKINTIGVKLFP
jgi:hypothetical protein